MRGTRHTRLWSIAAGTLGIGGLLVLGGVGGGGDLGHVVAGYGLLLLGGATYLALTLLVLERSARRAADVTAPDPRPMPPALQGRRVF